MSMVKWIGVGVGALFGVTVIMLVRSASGAQGGGGEASGPPIDTGVTSDEAERLTPDWTTEDFRALAEIARKYKMNGADLLLVLTSESGLKPSAAYRNAEGYPIAVGLNQLTSAANDLLGISEGERTQILKWSVSEQLPLVDKFFAGNPWTKTGEGYASAGTLYAANFAPARLISRGQSPETVLYDESDGPAYSQNKGLDWQGKGSITIGDMNHHLGIVVDQPTYKAALQRLRDATGDQTLSPVLPTS